MTDKTFTNPRFLTWILHSLNWQLTDLRFRISNLNSYKQSVFYRFEGRDFHITAPKYRIEFLLFSTLFTCSILTSWSRTKNIRFQWKNFWIKSFENYLIPFIFWSRAFICLAGVWCIENHSPIITSLLIDNVKSSEAIMRKCSCDLLILPLTQEWNK